MKALQPGKRQSRVARKKRVLRLLVVEDHADLRATLTTFLRALGCQARFVEDMAAALRVGGTEDFDVLLSDIGLPDGDGWELLRQLEAAGRRPVYAIAMSGFGLSEDAARSKAAGFALHLVKPFEPEDLEKALLDAQARVFAATA